MSAKIFNRHFFVRLGSAAFLSVGAALGFAGAQEISDAHVAASRAAVNAIKATDRFDSFLSDMSFELKNELMRKDPNLEEVISETVEEEAIKLAARRADLEKEVALAYVRHFSEEELTSIANFYNSDAGKKLLNEGPAAMDETLAAFDIWRQGMAQDLSVNVARALAQKVMPEGEAAPSEEQDTPSDPSEGQDTPSEAEQ